MKGFRFLATGSRRSFSLLSTGISVFLVTGCMISTKMPNTSYSGPFEPLSQDEVVVRDRLQKHVWMLADEIGERNIWHVKGLEASVHFIRKVLIDLGYDVDIQEYTVNGIPVRNLEATLTGSSLPEEIIVVGAHYDSVIGCPGANDNASGVAGLLELARLLATQELARTVRFVAFVNEEPPFFLSDEMGSLVYAKSAHQRGDHIVAMLSIETIGYYSEEPGSQQYPFPFSFFYPTTANFIGFVANTSSRDLLYRVIATFREHTAFPSEGIAAPEWVTGIGWSDHWSFWREGYPALMVTDTALFRYKHYHTAEDTPDKIDYARMARVITGMSHVIAELAGPTASQSNPSSFPK